MLTSCVSSSPHPKKAVGHAPSSPIEARTPSAAPQCLDVLALHRYAPDPHISSRRPPCRPSTVTPTRPTPSTRHARSSRHCFASLAPLQTDLQQFKPCPHVSPRALPCQLPGCMAAGHGCRTGPITTPCACMAGGTARRRRGPGQAPAPRCPVSASQAAAAVLTKDVEHALRIHITSCVFRQGSRCTPQQLAFSSAPPHGPYAPFSATHLRLTHPTDPTR